MVVKNTGGGASASTYTCDHQWVNNEQLDMALFGGACYDGLACGAFACTLSFAVVSHYWTVVASPSLHLNS